MSKPDDEPDIDAAVVAALDTESDDEEGATDSNRPPAGYMRLGQTMLGDDEEQEGDEQKDDLDAEEASTGPRLVPGSRTGGPPVLVVERSAVAMSDGNTGERAFDMTLTQTWTVQPTRTSSARRWRRSSCPNLRTPSGPRSWTRSCGCPRSCSRTPTSPPDRLCTVQYKL